MWGCWRIRERAGEALRGFFVIEARTTALWVAGSGERGGDAELLNIALHAHLGMGFHPLIWRCRGKV